MALPATDNFNRANANPIGGNWTQGSAGTMELLNNAASSAAGSSTSVWWNADTPDADQYAQCKIVGAFICSGPIARHQSGAATYYVVQVCSSTTMDLYRVTAGAFTLVGSRTTSTMTLSSSVVKVSVSGVGSTVTLRLYLDGVQQGADLLDTDAARIVTAGSFGFYSETTAGIVDDWEGGNLTVTVAPIVSRFSGWNRRKRNRAREDFRLTSWF